MINAGMVNGAARYFLPAKFREIFLVLVDSAFLNPFKYIADSNLTMIWRIWRGRTALCARIISYYQCARERLRIESRSRYNCALRETAGIEQT